MNGKPKFHKATGPAFNPGEVWVDSSKSTVKIVHCAPYPNVAVPSNPSDFRVVYEWNGALLDNDAWNFQVRYTHQADLHL